MAVAQTLPLLFIGRVLSGITSASFSTANAYIADVTPPEKRAAAFGKLGMAFGLGFVIAPAIGGLLGDMSPRLPFWIAAGLSLANFCYGYFVLPESLAGGAARAVFLAARQPGRLAAIPRPPSGSIRAGRRDLPDADGAHRLPKHASCSTPTTASAGARRWSATRWPASASCRRSCRAG